jgi:hypothetical protein
MDQLVSANSITKWGGNESSPSCPKNIMTNLEGDNGFGGHHIGGYTKLHNGSQWNEQPTNGAQLGLVYLK